MLELKRMFRLLAALILDFLFIVVWVLLSWLVHHYVIATFSLEGAQLYKFYVIEGVTDFAVFFRLYKFLFSDSKKNRTHAPWWY
jgi:hypothetical protein